MKSASISRILEPSPTGLISSMYIIIKHPFKLMRNRLNEAKHFVNFTITIDITEDFSIQLDVFNKLTKGSLLIMINYLMKNVLFRPFSLSR